MAKREYIKAFVGFMLLSLIACNPIKKAEQRVLLDKDAFNRVGQKWSTLFPPLNDTLIFSGGSDTAIVYDTVDVYVEKEPTIKPPHEYMSIAPAPINTPQKVYITKTLTIHDTIKAVTRDTRKEKFLQDSIDVKNKELSDVQLSGAEWKDKAHNRLWIIIAICVLIAAYFGFKGYKYIVSGGITGIHI